MPRSESSSGGAKDGDASDGEELVTAAEGWRSAATQLEGPARLPESGGSDPGERGTFVAKFDPVRRIWHLAPADAADAPASAEPKDGGGGGGERESKDGASAAAAACAPGRRPIDDAHAGPAPRHRDTRWNVLRPDSDASDADSDRDAVRAPDYLLGENSDAPEPKRGRRRARDGAKGGDGGGAKDGGAKGGGAKGDDDDDDGGDRGAKPASRRHRDEKAY